MRFIKCIFIITIIIKIVKSDDDETWRLETKLIKLVKDLNEEKSIEIYKDVIWVEKMNESRKSFEDGNEKQDELLARIDEFLRSHEIKIRLPNDGSSADMFGRALGKKNFDIELKSTTSGDFEGEN